MDEWYCPTCKEPLLTGGVCPKCSRAAPDALVEALIRKCIRERIRQLESWGHKGKALDCEMCQEHVALSALHPENVAAIDTLLRAATELLEVADLRGDTDLPHPANDPKLWSARMQDAWNALRAALRPESEGGQG